MVRDLKYTSIFLGEIIVFVCGGRSCCCVDKYSPYMLMTLFLPYT